MAFLQGLNVSISWLTKSSATKAFQILTVGEPHAVQPGWYHHILEHPEPLREIRLHQDKQEASHRREDIHNKCHI